MSTKAYASVWGASAQARVAAIKRHRYIYKEVHRIDGIMLTRKFRDHTRIRNVLKCCQSHYDAMHNIYLLSLFPLADI